MFVAMGSSFGLIRDCCTALLILTNRLRILPQMTKYRKSVIPESEAGKISWSITAHAC